MNKFCPNKNDKEYKKLASLVGTSKAHTIYAKNNGNPISLTADGNSSLIYQQLVKANGELKAIKMMSELFESNFKGDREALKVGPNGTVLINNDTYIQLGSKGVKTAALERNSMKQSYRLTGNKLEAITNAIRGALPGVNIEFGTFKDMKERAYVSKDGIRFNKESCNVDTPIHEVTHIWLNVIENNNPAKYKRFIEKVNESIKDNLELYNTIKSKYPENTEEELLKEYAATLSGFTSIDAVERYLASNSQAMLDDDKKGLLSKVFDIVNNFFELLRESYRNVFGDNSKVNNLDLKTATLNDVFNAITIDVLNGENILGLSGSETEMFMRDNYDEGYIEASIALEDSKTMIANVSDILPHIINNHDPIVAGNDQYTDNDFRSKLVDKIYSRLYPNKNNNGSYVFDFGKRYDFASNLTVDQIKNRIDSEIVTRQATIINSFNSKSIAVINKHVQDRSTPLYSKIEEVFSDMNLSGDVLSQLESALEHAGINEPILYAMNYKDLKNDKHLSHLYKDCLEGYNPMVLVHSDNKEKIDISIVDMTGGVLGRQDNNLSSNQLNLASHFNEPNSRFSYSNSKADVRKVIIATTVAGMNKLAKEKGQSIGIRRAGVIGFNGNRVSTNLISSMDEAFNNSKDLLRLSEMQQIMDKESLSYPFMKDLIDEDAAWNSNDVMQSMNNRLISYYSSSLKDEYLSYSRAQSFLDNLRSYNQIQLLKKRQMEIERNKSKLVGGQEEWMNDPEHKLISQYILWAKVGTTVYNSQVEDMNKLSITMINPHNIYSEALQHFSIEAESTKSIILNKVNTKKDEFNKLIEASLKSHGKSMGVVGNNPKDIFGHMFKKGKIQLEHDHGSHKKGDIVETVLFNQYYGSHNLDEAKAAGLTKEDIEFTDYLYNEIRSRFIELHMHKAKMSGKEITLADAKVFVDENYHPGTIPVLGATSSEKIRKGDFKGAFRAGVDKVSKMQYMPGDLLNSERQTTALVSMFVQQMTIDGQLKSLGLEKAGANNTETFNAHDASKFENHTMNVEYLFNMINLDSFRKIEMENRLIPVYNNVRQFMNILSSEYGKTQKNNEEWLRQYYNRVVLRKNNDDPDDKAAPIVRSVLGTFSFLSLGYRPLVWIRSGYYNEQNILLESLATKASDWNTANGNRLNIPGPKEMTKAHQLLFTDMAKVTALGKKLGIINSSEMEAIDSVFTTNIDKMPWKSQLSQLGNYYTDIAARLVSMTAYMVKDGSYDAHSYDKATNELLYDPKKDSRFYKDGKFISEEKKVLYDYMVERQLNEGLATDPEKLKVGYHFEESNTRFKWYADKFIIGSMDEYQRNLLGNTYTGQLFSQFRTFMFDKLFNTVGSNRKSLYGAENNVSISADGAVEIILGRMENEGTAASLWYMLSDLYKTIKTGELSAKDGADYFKNMSAMRKKNVAISLAKSVLLLSIIGGIKYLLDDLSDKDKQKLEWLYSELMPLNLYENLEGNLVPATTLISSISQILFGDHKLSRLLRYAGPWYDAKWFIELLGDDDDLYRKWGWTGAKTIDQMDKEELDEHYAELRKRRAQRAAKELAEYESNNN